LDLSKKDIHPGYSHVIHTYPCHILSISMSYPFIYP
jgi:hypothetical protein